MSRFHATEFDFYPEDAFRSLGGRLLTLEGGKKGPPPPDPGIAHAANAQMQLGREQFEDYKANMQPIIREQMQQGIRIANEQNVRQTQQQDYQMGRAKIMDDRWDKVQVPLEDRMIAQANKYNEAGEQERMAGIAGADVNTAYANSEAMQQRDMNRRGVNPNSGRAMAMSAQNAVARAGAEASAVTKTRQAAKDIGWLRMGEAAALGRNLPGFGTASAGLSISAGQGALSAGTAGSGIANGASAANNAGYTASGGLYQGAASGLNAQYSTQTQANTAANAQSGQAIGAVLGAGATIF